MEEQCITNCTPQKINVVIMAKAKIVRHTVNLTSQSALHHNQQRDSCAIDGVFQKKTAPNRIDVKFNKWLLIVVCFP